MGKPMSTAPSKATQTFADNDTDFMKPPFGDVAFAGGEWSIGRCR